MASSAFDATYEKVSKFVTNTQTANSKIAENGNQRKWFNFSESDSPGASPIYSPDYLTPIFDRDRLNKNITNVFTEKSGPQLGDMGICVVNTAQIMVVAGWERDLSSRFKSRVRSLAHRYSERNAEGTDNSPLRSSINRSMTNILKQYTAASNNEPSAGTIALANSNNNSDIA